MEVNFFRDFSFVLVKILSLLSLYFLYHITVTLHILQQLIHLKLFYCIFPVYTFILVLIYGYIFLRNLHFLFLNVILRSLSFCAQLFLQTGSHYYILLLLFVPYSQFPHSVHINLVHNPFFLLLFKSSLSLFLSLSLIRNVPFLKTGSSPYNADL